VGHRDRANLGIAGRAPQAEHQLFGQSIDVSSGRILNMPAAILVVMPEGYQGRAFFARIAPALTTSRIRKSTYNILEADSPSVLAQIIGVAERFGFSYRILHPRAPIPRWPLMIG
jgi:hypothetical protein